MPGAPEPAARPGGLVRRLTRGSSEELRFLASAYRRHRGLVALTLCLNLLATLFESSTIGILVLALRVLSGSPVDSLGSVPWLGEALVGLGQRLGQEGLFLALVGMAVTAQVAVSVLEFSSRAATAHLQADVEGDLRRRIFRQLMTMSYPQVMRRKVGELAAYNEQVGWVGQVIQLSNLVAGQLIMTIAYVVVLFWLSWQMTLVAVVAITLLSLSFRRIIRHIRGLGRGFTAAGVALNARTVEFLRGLRLLRTFAREEYAIRQVDAAVDDGVAYRRRGLTWNATIGPLADALTVTGVALFLLVGYLSLDERGPAVLARLIAFLFVLYRLLPRIKFINDRLGYINNYWEFVRRVAEILRSEDKEYAPTGGRPCAGLRQGIVLREVGLRYDDGEPWALRDLSVEIPHGQVVGVVGESGAGKSSLVDLLLGLYRPTTGALEIDGVDLREIDWRQWRDRLGVVTQDSFILHASVRENIAFGRLEAGEQEILAAARAADADGFIRGLAQGYDTVIGDRGYRLSAGQRQRLALARAILRNPEVLILDEATSQLDSRSERAIHGALARLRGGRTILIIAHRLSTLTRADRILVLDRGRLVESGTHQELLRQQGRYANLWRLQSRDPGPASREAAGA